MVNRIWRWHFGKGVTTPSDFGFRGAKPSHPKLLDWLAAEFIKSNWSIKAMHRLIMNSKVYQLASSDSDVGLAQDPDNTFRGDMRGVRLMRSHARRDVVC